VCRQFGIEAVSAQQCDQSVRHIIQRDESDIGMNATLFKTAPLQRKSFRIINLKPDLNT
jgi:hypothetical protein